MPTATLVSFNSRQYRARKLNYIVRVFSGRGVRLRFPLIMHFSKSRSTRKKLPDPPRNRKTLRLLKLPLNEGPLNRTPKHRHRHEGRRRRERRQLGYTAP
ncbi:hypothetical protein GWI33_000366 [Rhynchophorus ferrugineus]|uniref:Uncharacterized protein n=1 Tax=Rhynchophorus ferrugineus TaxID=354439 RepID=A0A834HML7_RHYFE|nr:hypothetical protein GWI33_000366 [Rhynchophorus ferrugineus]